MKGPVDHDVPVLAVAAADGKLRAVAFGYACHATVMDYLQWSGDYPGFAQIELEKSHPARDRRLRADQNPLPRRKVELAQKYGKQLADSVEAVLAAKMQPLGGSWSGVYREVDLPYREVPSREKLVQDTMSANKFEANRMKALAERAGSEGLAARPVSVSDPGLATGRPWQRHHLGDARRRGCGRLRCA